MSADDQTLPGRLGARRPRPTSARAMRAVASTRKSIDEAIKLDGALREHAIVQAIEAAIDAGGEVSKIQLDALRQQVMDQQGRIADLEQTVVFKDEKIARLEKALEQATKRLVRTER